MPFLTLKQLSVPVALFLAVGVQAQDLHIKKNVTVGGYTVSTTDTSIKGPRTREVLQTPAGTKVTIRQCDAHRTIHVNEQAQTYFQQDDPLTVAEARAAGRGTTSRGRAQRDLGPSACRTQPASWEAAHGAPAD